MRTQHAVCSALSLFLLLSHQRNDTKPTLLSCQRPSWAIEEHSHFHKQLRVLSDSLDCEQKDERDADKELGVCTALTTSNSGSAATLAYLQKQYDTIWLEVKGGRKTARDGEKGAGGIQLLENVICMEEERQHREVHYELSWCCVVAAEATTHLHNI